MEQTLKLNAIVIGATGAVGRELVDYLLSNNNYNKISIFVRRIIDRWIDLPEGKKEKLNIIEVENLDCLENENEIKSLLNDNLQYDVLFNALGSRVGRGNEEFRKVDFTYVVNSCILCEKLNISHFSNCSAANASKDSWFLYSRVKGEAEEECLKKNVNYISILRPGIILNRDNDDRFGEKVIAYIPFLPKITSKDIAMSMLVDDLEYQRGKKEKKAIRISHSEMEKLAAKGNQIMNIK
jgi:nucleoside-diphosphate-sugar epimerase